jgi:hypothetical protein
MVPLFYIYLALYQLGLPALHVPLCPITWPHSHELYWPVQKLATDQSIGKNPTRNPKPALQLRPIGHLPIKLATRGHEQ